MLKKVFSNDMNNRVITVRSVYCCLLIFQNTALHIGAKEGHAAAVKLMLARGAMIVLNKNETSFLHEAVQNGRKDVVNAVIDSDR